MVIEIIDGEFAVCKVEDLSQVHFEDAFCFVAKTDEEHSLVCSSERVPKNSIECEDHWRMFRIQGSLDFSLIGILSKITAVLAQAQIGLFAVSTYNTDYILVKKHHFETAISVLENNAYEVQHIER